MADGDEVFVRRGETGEGFLVTSSRLGESCLMGSSSCVMAKTG